MGCKMSTTKIVRYGAKGTRTSNSTGLWAGAKTNVKNYFMRKFRSAKVDKLRLTIEADRLYADALCPNRDCTQHQLKTIASTQAVHGEAAQVEEYQHATHLELLQELPFYEVGQIMKARKTKSSPLARKVQIIAPATCCSYGTQVEQLEEGCQSDPPQDLLDDTFRTFGRKSINRMVKKAKVVKTYSKLTNFLRCKFFMRLRDHSLINTMVNDARVWMIKQGFTCETDEDFFVLSQSVLVAFLINEQEIKFRAVLKDSKNWDNMAHVNKTVAGNLGKVSLLRSMKENSLLGGFLPDLKFPGAVNRPV